MKQVDGYIKRCSLIYKTGVEYGDYTLNHVLGCAHGCQYPCYAYLMARRFGKVKSYDEWVKPKLVSNINDILEKEIPRFKKKVKSVHLCFTTDPFMLGYNEISKSSLSIIQKLNAENIACSALTKGLLPEELRCLSSKNQYGITLISLNEEFRKKMEPGASPYKDRIKALFQLHQAGCKTWVSIEPYPTPNIIDQDFLEILNSVEFVDKIIFGKMNYNSNITKYSDRQEYYNELSEQTIEFCKSHGIDYYIKKGTQTTIKQKCIV